MGEQENIVKLFLFGLPYVVKNGKSIHISRKKTIALLTYLIVHQTPFTRNRLSALFWTDCDYTHAHTNLRKVLYEIHSLLGKDVLKADRESIGPLDMEKVWIDIHEFQQISVELWHADKEDDPETYKSKLQSVIRIYTDDVLSGFSFPDCDVFDEWLFLYTEYLRQILSTDLELLSNICETIGDIETGIEAARRLLELDSLNEEGHRALIRLFIQSGRFEAALQQYRLCENILQRELGIEPEEQTVKLLHHIRARQQPTVPSHIIISPQADQAPKPIKIGPVEKIVQRLRFDEKISDEPLSMKSSKELCILGDLTLRSSIYHDDNIIRARKYYCRASQLNPHNSDAFAGLAFTYFSLGGYGVDARINERKKVRLEKIIEQALSQNPINSNALMVLAGKKMEWDWDFAEAERIFLKALEYNPDHPNTLLWYGELLMCLGRFNEAYPHLLKSHELMPSDIAVNYRLAKYYYRVGKYNSCINLLQMIDELYPNRYLVNSLLGRALLEKGDYRSALRAAEYGISLQINEVTLTDLAIARAFAGKREAAEKALEQSINEYPNLGYEDAYCIALAAHLLEKDEIVFDWLYTAFQNHEIMLIKTASEPLWTNLHWNLQFQELIIKIGLPLCLFFIESALSRIEFPEHFRITHTSPYLNGNFHRNADL